MIYGHAALRPVGYGHQVHPQQAAVAATVQWPHGAAPGAQPSASNLTGTPIKLPPPRARSESPIKNHSTGAVPSTHASDLVASSAGTVPLPITGSTVGATRVANSPVGQPQHPQPLHLQVGQPSHPHVGQPVFKLGSPGSNVAQVSATKAQVEKSTVMTTAQMTGQPISVFTTRVTPVLPATAGVSPPRYPQGMQRMPFMQSAAPAFYAVPGTGPPYLLPSPNNMHAMTGFNPMPHIGTAFPQTQPPLLAHLMGPRVAAGVTTQDIQVPPPMLSPGGTLQKHPLIALAKPTQPMMPVSAGGPLSPSIAHVDKNSASATSFLSASSGTSTGEHHPSVYQFPSGVLSAKPVTSMGAGPLAQACVLESKNPNVPRAPHGKFTRPFPQQPSSQFQLSRKEDETVLFQNPYLQREFHNYILQTEGRTAANSFMSIIQHYNHTITLPVSQNPLHPAEQNVSVSERPSPIRAAHSESNFGHLRGSGTESPSKNAPPKRETVSVRLEELPRSGSHDSVASHGLDISDHSDHSSRSSFSDRSRETSSPLAPSGNGFPFNMQPGMGPVHTLSYPQSFGAKQHLQTHNQNNGYPRPQQNGGHLYHRDNAHTFNNLLQRNCRSKGEDALNDVELPTAVDNMVKFIEEGLGDKHSENELDNIHKCHSSGRLHPALSRPRSAAGERQAPLYLRRASEQGGSSQTQPNLSYASALRSQLPACSSPSDVLRTSSQPVTSVSTALLMHKDRHEPEVSSTQIQRQQQQIQQLQLQQRRQHQGLGFSPAIDSLTTISSSPGINYDSLIPISAGGGRQLSRLMTTSLLPPPTTDTCTPEMTKPADPLDLLKNLNIKASPGTQALYQYFS